MCFYNTHNKNEKKKKRESTFNCFNINNRITILYYTFFNLQYSYPNWIYVHTSPQPP